MYYSESPKVITLFMHSPPFQEAKHALSLGFAPDLVVFDSPVKTPKVEIATLVKISYLHVIKIIKKCPIASLCTLPM